MLFEPDLMDDEVLSFARRGGCCERLFTYSFVSKFCVVAVLLVPYKLSFRLKSGDTGGAASYERIEHDIAREAVEFNESSRKFDRKRSRMTYTTRRLGWKCPYAFCEFKKLIATDGVLLSVFRAGERAF